MEKCEQIKTTMNKWEKPNTYNRKNAALQFSICIFNVHAHDRFNALHYYFNCKSGVVCVLCTVRCSSFGVYFILGHAIFYVIRGSDGILPILWHRQYVICMHNWQEYGLYIIIMHSENIWSNGSIENPMN